MDQELIKLFTRLKVFSKKQLGLDIDLIRMSSDRKYAEAALTRASQAEDPDLVAVAIELMGRLQIIRLDGTPEPEPEPTGDGPSGNNYVGRLR